MSAVRIIEISGGIATGVIHAIGSIFSKMKLGLKSSFLTCTSAPATEK